MNNPSHGIIRGRQIELEHDPGLPEGTRIAVVFVPASDASSESNELPSDYRDLLAAANHSLQFWDNPADDEDWNDA